MARDVARGSMKNLWLIEFNLNRYEVITLNSTESAREIRYTPPVGVGARQFAYRIETWICLLDLVVECVVGK